MKILNEKFADKRCKTIRNAKMNENIYMTNDLQSRNVARKNVVRLVVRPFEIPHSWVALLLHEDCDVSMEYTSSGQCLAVAFCGSGRSAICFSSVNAKDGVTVSLFLRWRQ